jgi:hypothetical protein
MNGCCQPEEDLRPLQLADVLARRSVVVEEAHAEAGSPFLLEPGGLEAAGLVVVQGHHHRAGVLLDQAELVGADQGAHGGEPALDPLGVEPDSVERGLDQDGPVVSGEDVEPEQGPALPQPRWERSDQPFRLDLVAEKRAGGSADG